MARDAGRRVVDVLEAEGPTMPIVVLARRLGIPPSRVAAMLDDLYDEGLVTTGRERGTVSLVPQPVHERRFSRTPAADSARAKR